MEDLRITSGDLRGRKIKSPRSKLAHPMGSREKIALFNTVRDFIAGSFVLDAFAGSGALGIEALSRGAGLVVFVEKSPEIARVIRENLTNLGISEKSEVVCGDVSKYTSSQRFQLILADPPYDKFEALDLDDLGKLLDKNGVLALSHPGEPPEISGLKLTRTKKYAKAHISIYQKST